MAQLEPTLPTLHTLSMLPLREADILLSVAERLYGTQFTIEAHHALRRVDTYRRLLGLTLSINGMERITARSVTSGEHARRSDITGLGTA